MVIGAFFIRLLLAAVFLMSSLTKITAPNAFVRNVLQYRLLPDPVARGYAVLLPYAELAVAVLLLTGFAARWAGLVAAALLMSFMAAVGVAIARKLNLHCSCFGLLYRERVGWATLTRDGVLLALSLIIAIADPGAMTIAHLVEKPSNALSIVALMATTVVVVFSLCVAFLSIKRSRRPLRTPGLSPF